MCVFDPYVSFRDTHDMNLKNACASGAVQITDDKHLDEISKGHSIFTFR